MIPGATLDPVLEEWKGYEEHSDGQIGIPIDESIGSNVKFADADSWYYVM